jgi:hypothetical protein
MSQTINFLTWNLLFTVISIVAIGWLLTQKDLLRSHKILIVLLLVGTFMVSFGQFIVATTDAAPFWRWLFNMDDDRNIPASFSALVWLVLAVLLVQYGRYAKIPRLQRFFWIGLAAVFAWIAFDDYYAFHEFILTDWLSKYLVVAAIVGIVGIVAFFVWLLPDFLQRRKLFVFLCVGVGMMGFSAFILEGFIWDMCDEALAASLCRNRILIRVPDEIFELIGPVLIIGGLILYMQSRMTNAAWRTTMLTCALVTALGAAVMLGYFYPMPSIENRLLAQPVTVQYGDEAELIGYWIDNPTPAPGERVNLLLYWQTPNQMRRPYNMSVHLLSYPDRQSYTQADRVRVGQLPYSGWIPGLVIRGAVHLDIPADIPTPGSYTISVRVGEYLGAGENAQGLPITESNLQTDYGDTFFLPRISIIATDEPQPLTNTAAYHFAEGFTLAGYDMPAQITYGEDLNIAFHWQATQAVNRSLQQFIHIFDAEGVPTAFDRTPFNVRFPTEDWIAGLNSIDTAQITLGEALVPGVYQVYTGMYDAQTIERIPVTDNANQPIQDWAIYLGEFEIIDSQ